MLTALRERYPVVTSLAGFVIAAALFGWMWSDYLDYWIDDAFITFRYSRHLSEGFGPVFNVGERVQGYTSFLWMVFSALPIWLADEASAIVSLKISGLLAGLWILYRVWSFPGIAGPAQRWCVVLLATHPDFVINCGDGMETPLFMALTVECMRAMTMAPGRRSGLVTGGLTTALVMTRPESLPLLLALPAIQLFGHASDPPRRPALRAWLVAFAVAAFVPVLLYLAWIWSYYGYPFPNTYYAKVVGSRADRFWSGMRELQVIFFGGFLWMKPYILWMALPLVGLAHLRVARAWSAQARVWVATLWLFVLFRVSFNLYSGTETMGHHRFITPAWIPLLLLADEGARVLWRGPARAVVLLACAVALYFNVVGHEVHVRATQAYKAGLWNAHVALGHWLRQETPEESWVALGDVGAVSFFSERPIIDLWGLNDSTIAHMPGLYGKRPGTADYVLGRKPEIIVLWNTIAFDATRKHPVQGWTQFDRGIAKHPEFDRHYRFVREFVFRPWSSEVPGYHLDVFARAAEPRRER